MLLWNKKPQWNEAKGEYQLNFHGRVRCPSVNNFILENIFRKPQQEEGEDQGNDHVDVGEEHLLFGKVEENTYALDFCYPLSPIQAFGICLSSLDRKTEKDM